MLFVFVLIAVGAIGASTLLGVALGRAAARGDAELEDRRMRALAMRERTIRAWRLHARRPGRAPAQARVQLGDPAGIPAQTPAPR
jgi:hypothetical protein